VSGCVHRRAPAAQVLRETPPCTCDPALRFSLTPTESNYRTLWRPFLGDQFSRVALGSWQVAYTSVAEPRHAGIKARGIPCPFNPIQHCPKCVSARAILAQRGLGFSEDGAWPVMGSQLVHSCRKLVKDGCRIPLSGVDCRHDQRRSVPDRDSSQGVGGAAATFEQPLSQYLPSLGPPMNRRSVRSAPCACLHGSQVLKPIGEAPGRVNVTSNRLPRIAQDVGYRVECRQHPFKDAHVVGGAVGQRRCADRCGDEVPRSGG